MDKRSTLRRMALEMRRALPNDVGAITAIEASAFSDPWSQRSFEELFGRDEVLFDVAVEGEVVIGYSVVYAAAGESELANVAVASASRGCGVGGALLARACSEAAARGASEMWLEVRASNVAARALYIGAGFSEVGARKKYYREPVEDAIVMHRTLAFESARPQ